MSSASLERYFQAVLDSRTASVPEQQDLDLEELLKPDNVWECIKDDPETQQALLPLLPEGTQTLAGLREMVYSAQYRQTVQTLALVLQNGDAGPLLAEMRLPLDAQGPDNGITRFLTVCASSHHRSSVCICVGASAPTPRTPHLLYRHSCASTAMPSDWFSPHPAPQIAHISRAPQSQCNASTNTSVSEQNSAR